MCKNNCFGKELIALASTLSIYISQNKSADEINILACLFTAIGDNLAIIAATCQEEKKEEL